MTSGRASSPAAPVALTIGEPGGIGPELCLLAWRGRAQANLPAFFVVGDPEFLARVAGQCGLDVGVRTIDGPAEALSGDDRLPVLPLKTMITATPGMAGPETAGAVIESIDRAVGFVHSGDAAAVVTNPIQKAPLYQAGFDSPGHTEYLGKLDGRPGASVMMLVAGDLRVVPVTVHLPLADVSSALSSNLIVRHGRVVAAALQQDFGVTRPRLAVAAFNPHAGEAGTIGREEIEIIEPAVLALRAEGLHVIGPMPADSLFHAEARPRSDAVLCMYHDQALIPLKTVDFWGGVNVTLGLSFVRTSPDHGTALDIAGTGKANPTSLVNAIRLAAEIAGNRAAAHGR